MDESRRDQVADDVSLTMQQVREIAADYARLPVRRTRVINHVEDLYDTSGLPVGTVPARR